MEHKNGDTIELKCPKCGCNKAKVGILSDVNIVEYYTCTKCNGFISSKVVGKTGKQRPETIHNAQCPYCKSYNTKKITKKSKMASVALFGIFAIGKTAKEWHCNTCDSDF